MAIPFSPLAQIRGILDTVAEVWGPEQQAMIDSLWSDVMLRRLAAGGWDFERARQCVPPIVWIYGMDAGPCIGHWGRCGRHGFANFF